MSFDISSLEVTDTFDVEITNPTTGEPLIGDGGKPCTVTVYGPGTKPFAAAQSAASNRSMKRLRQKGRIDTTPEEDAASTASMLTTITVSFNNFSYKDMPSGPEAFRALYLDQKLGFITQQVNAAAGDWGNFSRAA